MIINTLMIYLLENNNDKYKAIEKETHLFKYYAITYFFLKTKRPSQNIESFVSVLTLWHVLDGK